MLLCPWFRLICSYADCCRHLLCHRRYRLVYHICNILLVALLYNSQTATTLKVLTSKYRSSKFQRDVYLLVTRIMICSARWHESNSSKPPVPHNLQSDPSTHYTRWWWQWRCWGTGAHPFLHVEGTDCLERPYAPTNRTRKSACQLHRVRIGSSWSL